MIPEIAIHIDELLLSGFAPGARGRIAAALVAELTRLLSEEGVPPALLHSATVDDIDGGAFRLDPGARPETLGNRIAGAIYQQWTRQTE